MSMPGTNTTTGTRSSNNPYMKSLGSLRRETPERFLSPNDSSRLLRVSQQAANEDAYRQQDIGQQNQQAAMNRQRIGNSEAFNFDEQSKQNDFNRRMQEKEWDAKQANKTVSFTNVVDNSAQNNFQRQKQLMQMQNQQELVKADRDRQNQQTMQAAQLAAQERLARLQQQTAVLAGSPGESTWRWF